MNHARSTPDTHAYSAWMQGHGLRPYTITQRVQFADARLREWGTFDLDPAALALWLGQHTGWTAVTYYTHLTSIYRWLVEVGSLPVDPMSHIRRPRRPRPHPQPLTQAELAAVLDGTTGHLRAFILLASLAGLRSHEVAKVRGEDVDAGAIYVDGKGGQAATVPTHPDLWDLAQSFPRQGYWFPSPVREGQPYSAQQVGALVARRFREVGIEHGSIHRLRATYGTELLRKGSNLRIVQTLMRHASLAITERYLGVSEEERAAAIRSLVA